MDREVRGATVIRVVVADDQAAVRDGLVTILEHATGIEVVAAAGDGAEAIDLVAATRPDVVLMDLRMPGTDGVAATAAIAGAHPASKVLVLTTYADDESIAAALRAGAAGYVTKSAGRQQIVAAITATHNGVRTFAPEVADVLARGLDARSALDRVAREHGLTAQETRVFELLARGESNRRIAETLFVSIATVKTHVNNLFAKLGVNSRSAAVQLLADSR